MISLCLIVKNEEQILERCLNSFKGYYDELIIVDTGSTDSTKDIAKRYTSKVFDFEWCDDFSKARNFSIEQAAGDYILVLDTDEFLDEDFDMNDIRKLIEKNPAGVGRIKRINPYVRDGKDYRLKDNCQRQEFIEMLFRYYR